jgi:hypothetical protein
MTKYLLTVDYNGGVVDTPMTEWAPEEEYLIIRAAGVRRRRRSG